MPEPSHRICHGPGSRCHPGSQRRNHTEPDRRAALDELTDRVAIHLTKRRVHAHRRRARGTEQPQRRHGRAAVNRNRHVDGADHRAQCGLEVDALRDSNRPEPAFGRDPTLHHRREARLVQLQDQASVRYSPTHVGQVLPSRLGERGDQIGHRAAVTQRAATTRKVERRRQGPGTGELHLEHPVVARTGDRHDRVEIGGHQLDGRTLVQPRPVDQAPAGRRAVDAQSHQLSRRPSDHVRTRTAAGKLGKVRQLGQLVEREGPRRVNVSTGQRTQARCYPSQLRVHHRADYVTPPTGPRTCQR